MAVTKKLYIVVTDGAQVLVVEHERQLGLPCYAHWPVTKPVPRAGWPKALLKHISYGYFSDVVMPTRVTHQPQLPPGVRVVRLFVSYGVLERTVKTCRRLRLWMKYNLRETDTLWKLRLVPVGPPPLMDPVSMQCWGPGGVGAPLEEPSPDDTAAGAPLETK